MRCLLLSAGILFAFPLFTYAIEITEIMYDFEGGDDPHEWIELYNNEANSVDLTDWRFNDGSNHILNAPPENGGQGSLAVPSGGFAILADDAVTFLADNPGFSGTVIDTVMSLANTGDTLSLFDADGVEVESVTYTSDTGGAGDGTSLQLIGSTWSTGTPTPGASNSSTPPPPQPEGDNGNEPPTDEDGEESRESTMTENKGSPAVFADFSADAGGDRFGVTGASIYFDGMGYGLKGEPLAQARYIWNFGDGSLREGQHIMHTFMHPGTYVVTLNISSGKFSASDRSIVTVRDADIELLSADADRIEIANHAAEEIDLSSWRLKHGNVFFTFPKYTILLPDHVGIFPREVTGFTVMNPYTVSLHYPNGALALAYGTNQSASQNNLIVMHQRPHVEKNTVAVIREVLPSTQLSQTIEPEISEEVSRETATSGSVGVTSPDTLTASAITTASESEGRKTLYKWLLALVVVVSLASMVVISRERPRAKKKELRADDFKIIE